MIIYILFYGLLKLDVFDQGGVIEGFWCDMMLFLCFGKKSGVVIDVFCFLLVLFVNWVSGNCFVWQGCEY